MIRHLVTLLVACAAPAAPVDDADCTKSLAQSDEFVPAESHRQRLVSKILENAGDAENKFWHAPGGGNVGLRVYVVPHARASRFLDVATAMFGGQHFEGLRREYDARSNALVGVLETHDEPTLSVVILPKDHLEPTRKTRLKLNPVDSEGSEAMKRLVPGAWASGHFESHHLLWEMLKDAPEVRFPGVDARPGWTIERYR